MGVRAMCMNRIKDIDLIRHKGPAKILRRITGLAINCTTQVSKQQAYS